MKLAIKITTLFLCLGAAISSAYSADKYRDRRQAIILAHMKTIPPEALTETEATEALTEIAETVVALNGRSVLQNKYKSRAESIIKSFPTDNPIRSNLKNSYNTYIAEQSLIIFKELLESSQYTNAYNFSKAYPDVFLTVDSTNAASSRRTSNATTSCTATIQKTVTEWFKQIQDKAMLEVKEFAELFAAFNDNRELQLINEQYARNIIGAFPRGTPIRAALQACFDRESTDQENFIMPAKERQIFVKMENIMFGLNR